MNNKLLSCLVAAALGATLAGAAPAFAHGGGGGGGGHGGGGGGMHGGGGGMHFGGGGGWHGGGMHSGHFSRFAFHDRGHFFHHRFHRFAFVGAYADYNGCLRRVWTSYGPRWVNVCGDYGY
jgi:hypothetical protein